MRRRIMEVCGGECVFVRIWFFLRQVARYLPFVIYRSLFTRSIAVVV